MRDESNPELIGIMSVIVIVGSLIIWANSPEPLGNFIDCESYAIIKAEEVPTSFNDERRMLVATDGGTFRIRGVHSFGIETELCEYSDGRFTITDLRENRIRVK